MHIAIEGCSHGELDIIYNTIERLQLNNNFKIDLLLCCGDFQSVRNEQDLKCMAVPIKYMQMQDFHRYYSGEKKAPVLTIMIGGNHEASNYLQELPFGGWLAPNIYYLGYAGIVNVGGLRIGGLTGIYKGNDYLKGHYEKTPYTTSSIRSVYHVRNLEVFRLKQLSGHMDMFMSHDWPRGIYHHGDISQLLKYKPDFEHEVNTNTLGSRPAEELLSKIRPTYWFSGHLHIKFAAVLKHKEPVDGKPKETKFLALDKCLPRREFLQILDVPSTTGNNNLCLSHDVEWLTILRLTNHLLSVKDNTVYMPGPGSTERYNFTPTEAEINETNTKMGGNLEIPLSNFCKTSKCFEMSSTPRNLHNVSMPKPLCNPQTQNLCSMLGLDDPLSLLSAWSSEGQDNKGRKCSMRFNKSELNVTMNSSRLSSTGNEMENQSDDEIDHSTDIIFDFTGEDLGSVAEESEVTPVKSEENITPPKKYNDILIDSSPSVDEGSHRKGMRLSLPKDADLHFSPMDADKMSTPIRKSGKNSSEIYNVATLPVSPIPEKYTGNSAKNQSSSWLSSGIDDPSSQDESTAGDEKVSETSFKCASSNTESSSPDSSLNESGVIVDVAKPEESKSKRIKRRNVAIYAEEDS